MKNIILGFLLIIIILGLLYYFKNVKEGLTLADPALKVVPFDPMSHITAMGIPGGPLASPFYASGGTVIDKYFKKYAQDWWNMNVLDARTVDQAKENIQGMEAWGKKWLIDGLVNLPGAKPMDWSDGPKFGDIKMSFGDDEFDYPTNITSVFLWEEGTQRGYNSNTGKHMSTKKTGNAPDSPVIPGTGPPPDGINDDGFVPEGVGGNVLGQAAGMCSWEGFGANVVKVIIGGKGVNAGEIGKSVNDSFKKASDLNLDGIDTKNVMKDGDDTFNCVLVNDGRAAEHGQDTFGSGSMNKCLEENIVPSTNFSGRGNSEDIRMWAQGSNSKDKLTADKVAEMISNTALRQWEPEIIGKNPFSMFKSDDGSPTVLDALSLLALGEWGDECQEMDEMINALTVHAEPEDKEDAVTVQSGWFNLKDKFLQLFLPPLSTGSEYDYRIKILHDAKDALIKKPWVSTLNKKSEWDKKGYYKEIPGLSSSKGGGYLGGYGDGTGLARNYNKNGTGMFDGGVSIVTSEYITPGTGPDAGIPIKPSVFSFSIAPTVGKTEGGLFKTKRSASIFTGERWTFSPGHDLNGGLGTYSVNIPTKEGEPRQKASLLNTPIRGGIVGNAIDVYSTYDDGQMIGSTPTGVTIDVQNLEIPGQSGGGGKPDNTKLPSSCFKTWTNICSSKCGIMGEDCKKQLLGEPPFEKNEDSEEFEDAVGKRIIDSPYFNPMEWNGAQVAPLTASAALLSVNQFFGRGGSADSCWKNWNKECADTIRNSSIYDDDDVLKLAKEVAPLGGRTFLDPDSLPPDDGIETWLDGSTPAFNPEGIGNIINYISKDGTGRKSIIYKEDNGVRRWTDHDVTTNVPPTYGTTTYGTTTNVPPTYGTTTYGKPRRRKSSRRRSSRRKSPRRRSSRRKSPRRRRSPRRKSFGRKKSRRDF